MMVGIAASTSSSAWVVPRSSTNRRSSSSSSSVSSVRGRQQGLRVRVCRRRTAAALVVRAAQVREGRGDGESPNVFCLSPPSHSAPLFPRTSQCLMLRVTRARESCLLPNPHVLPSVIDRLTRRRRCFIRVLFGCDLRLRSLCRRRMRKRLKRRRRATARAALTRSRSLPPPPRRRMRKTRPPERATESEAIPPRLLPPKEKGEKETETEMEMEGYPRTRWTC